jgi:hypothetical protein
MMLFVFLDYGYKGNQKSANRSQFRHIFFVSGYGMSLQSLILGIGYRQHGAVTRGEAARHRCLAHQFET